MSAMTPEEVRCLMLVVASLKTPFPSDDLLADRLSVPPSLRSLSPQLRATVMASTNSNVETMSKTLRLADAREDGGQSDSPLCP